MSQFEGASLEDLWTRWVAGQTLDAGDRAALSAGLEQNEVFRRRVVQDWQVHNALRAAADGDRGRGTAVARVKAAVRRLTPAMPRSWRPGAGQRGVAGMSRRATAAAALAAAAALGLTLFWPRADHRRLQPGGPGRGKVVLSSVAGRVTVRTARGNVLGLPSMPLAAGDSVATVGASARAVISHGDGRLELGADSALTVLAAAHGDTSVLLFHGQLTAASADATQPAALRLGTPHATVIGRGRLAITVSPRQTSVDVREGRARVVPAGGWRESELGAGQSTTIRPDSAGSRVVGDGRQVLLLVASGESDGAGVLAESDRLFRSRLEGLGFEVDVVAPSAASEDDLRRARVVVLSFTIDAGALPASFAELPVPIVAVESSAFTQLGFTGPRWKRDVGNGPRLMDITVINPEHPLAAGLSGSVRVLARPQRVRWAAPPATATAIASYPGTMDDETLVFAYEKGDFTAEGRAAARRVGLFLGNDKIVRSLTEQGWRLFDAAVSWAAGESLTRRVGE